MDGLARWLLSPGGLGGMKPTADLSLKLLIMSNNCPSHFKLKITQTHAACLDVRIFQGEDCIK